MIFTIYLIVNKLNGKVYVGQTRNGLGKRWYTHKNDALKRRHTYPICNAIAKYGPDAFTISAIDHADTQEQADFLEDTWIFLYDSRNPEVGYNIRPGGNVQHMSPEGRERLRQAHLGKSLSPEHRKLLSESGKRAWAEGRRTQHPVTDRMIATAKERVGIKNKLFRQDLRAEEFLFLVNNGVSFGRIATYFGISRGTVSRRVKSLDLPYIEHTSKTGSPNGRHVSYKEIDESSLRQLCESGIPMMEICRRLGRPHNQVYPRMKALGITRKKLNDSART